MCGLCAPEMNGEEMNDKEMNPGYAGLRPRPQLEGGEASVARTRIPEALVVSDPEGLHRVGDCLFIMLFNAR